MHPCIDPGILRVASEDLLMHAAALWNLQKPLSELITMKNPQRPTKPKRLIGPSFVDPLVSSFLLAAVLLAAGPARAQNYNVLYSFTGGADGGQPVAGLISDGAGNLYGTTQSGGILTRSCAPQGCGVVFKLDLAGKETVLYTFTGGADGAFPEAALVRDSTGILYGTTTQGGVCSWIYGPKGCGVVFKLDPTTGQETILYSFTGGADGALPQASLFLDNAGILYGTTSQGGGDASGLCQAIGCGVVFKLDPSTSTYTVLYTFTGAADGGQSTAGLVQDSAGNFYGTTSIGGVNVSPCAPGCGVIFKLDPIGTETVLYTFTGQADGSTPVAALIRDANGNLYGTTQNGGSYGWGVAFKLDPTGKESVLHEFTGASDGATPRGGLISDAAGNLYGAAMQGGTGTFFTNGVIFEIDSTGTYIVLHTLAASGAEGMNPYAGLLMDSAGNLYGTASGAGASCPANSYSCGVVFEVTPGVITSFNVSVVMAGNGAGTVTSNPAGIDCGSACSANFSSGTTVTLTASATPGSAFEGWGGSCSGSDGCTVTAGVSVTATFDAVLPDFSLTPTSASLTVQPGGEGTDTIKVAPQNGAFGNAIQLSCAITGPSPTPTCALSPALVTLGANSVPSTLTFTAPAAAAMLAPAGHRQPSKSLYALWLPLMFGIPFVGASKKQGRRYWVLGGVLLLLVLLQTACGGSNYNSVATQGPTNYTVTVTGASGTITHTVQVTVTVQ
jgi:uncharacterized repeat protein (TIGR03803 family)